MVVLSDFLSPPLMVVLDDGFGEEEEDGEVKQVVHATMSRSLLMWLIACSSV